MVNANKHKQLKSKIGMLPTEDMEQMEMIVAKMIQDVNTNPQKNVDALDELHKELDSYYESIKDDSRCILKIGTCQRILEIYEHVSMFKETLYANYHALEIDSNDIKSNLNACDGVLNAFKDIQARQNKNIDNKTHGGFESVKQSEQIENVDYPKEQFENIIRLKESIKLVGLKR